jgi:hypothetical protein
MTDRPRATVTVSATHIGRTDLGHGSVIVDEDALTIVTRGPNGDRPIRVPLGMLDAAVLSKTGDELTVALRDGTRITLASPGSVQLRDDLFARCRALPELTRALRTLGSRRRQSARPSSAGDQQRFFAPLLQARRAAGTASSPASVIAAFDGAALTTAYDQTLREFAKERFTEVGPARRALDAELSDLAEPLMNAFQSLSEAATSASASVDDLKLWRTWAAQLRNAFEAADRVWPSLDVALNAGPVRT